MSNDSPANRGGPFSLPPASGRRFSDRAYDFARPLVERVLGLADLNAKHARLQSRDPNQTFIEGAIGEVGFRYEFDEAALRAIPAAGPLVIVANHPYGGADGLVMFDLLRRVRDDARSLSTFILGRIPEMARQAFFVDPFGGAEAAKRSRAGLRDAISWLRDGHTLLTFPAGEVASFRWRDRRVSDPPWLSTVGKLIDRTDATVVPMWFEGRNSALFHAAGLIHPRLRTALIPRELIAMRGKTVRVHIGEPLPIDRLRRAVHVDREGGETGNEDFANGLMHYLRLRVQLLSERSATGRKQTPKPAGADHALSGERRDLSDEVRSLPPQALLVRHGHFGVYCAAADQIPHTLQEIGRLRELAFRAVGEGTGRAADLDRFDPHYQHLFAWDHSRNEVAGAYRLGPTDELLARFGPGGLYTQSLFEFSPRLLQQISPAIELGRSFVSLGYQRDYAPLMLLWKGIGAFAARHPRYRRLFGVVSISDEFSCVTQELLMAFLRANQFDEELARGVRARRPPKIRMRELDANACRAMVRDIRDVEQLVRDLEADHRGMPVLLRQYLKLDAKILGFNVDPEFGNTLDALALVDLPKVDRSILTRFMGGASVVDQYLAAGAAADLAFSARNSGDRAQAGHSPRDPRVPQPTAG
ncbi:MAG: GNAT family N-acyltransferase [Phycisphaerae bacterium]|nr:GNAT family N-acyltransferase [Phycisphaerae bacterium]